MKGCEVKRLLYDETIPTISTPNDHQSALCVCPLLLTTSGAMYSIVPQKEYALLSWSMASLLNPKSGTERQRDIEGGEQGQQKD